MIEKAVDYAGQREQFGRLIGSFQAVKHMCAEMAARHEPCRSLVWYAAHAFEAVPNEASLVACHATSHPAEVHRFVARTSTEVTGRTKERRAGEKCVSTLRYGWSTYN